VANNTVGFAQCKVFFCFFLIFFSDCSLGCGS